MKKRDTTLIRVKISTKRVLNNEKIYPRETYDEVIQRLYIKSLPKTPKKLLKTIKKGKET